MNSRLGGPLGYYALVLVLLGVQWRPGFSYPTTTTTTTSCDDAVARFASLTNLLEHEAKKLQHEYEQFHDICCISESDPVLPDSKISGNTISEKLQDIYIKDVLFEMHMSKVKEYQGQHSVKDETVDTLLAKVERRLSDTSHILKLVFRNTDPKIPLPKKPAPPKLSHGDDYTKKLYGLGVIVRLTEWATQVSQLLKAGEICKVHQEGRP